MYCLPPSSSCYTFVPKKVAHTGDHKMKLSKGVGHTMLNYMTGQCQAYQLAYHLGWRGRGNRLAEDKPWEKIGEATQQQVQR